MARRDSRLDRRGRGENFRLLKDFIEGKDLGGEMHSLRAPERQAAVIFLDRTGFAGLCLRALFTQVLPHLFQERARPARQKPDERCGCKTGDKGNRFDQVQEHAIGLICK